MSKDVLLTILIVLPFVGSVIAATFRPNARNSEAWLAGGVALICLSLTAFAYPTIADGGVVRTDVEWIPEFGLSFALRLDGFAWMFAMLVTGIGFLVVLYARYYMSPSDPVPRFFSLLLAFMGSMLGIIIAGNLIILVFFWELTSIFSFLLIGYWHGNAGARDGARMALLVTGLGGFALLAGVISDRPNRRKLRPRYRAGIRRGHPGAFAIPPGVGSCSPRSAHEERAIPIPLLAAQRHGSADPCLGLLALRDDGQGGRLPVGAPVASHGRHAGMVLAARSRRDGVTPVRCVLRYLPARYERAPGLFDDQPSRVDHDAP